MADRVAIMDAGRMQQIGSPQAVYDRPANLFVARFVGSPPMNIISGALAPARRSVAMAGVQLPAAASLCERFSARASVPVEVGIRPEHLRLTDPARPGLQFPAAVTHVEALGHEQLVHATASGGPLVVRVPLLGGGLASPAISPGTIVNLGVDPADVHLFDAATGARLDA